MHVQPSLPEVGIHGEDGLPVGSKLGLRGVFGSTVLQRQDLKKRGDRSVGGVTHTKARRGDRRIFVLTSSLLTGGGR